MEIISSFTTLVTRKNSGPLWLAISRDVSGRASMP